MINLSEHLLERYLTKSEVDDFIEQNHDILLSAIEGRYGLQSFLGWFSVERNTADVLMDSIEKTAERIKQEADIFIVVGVGGSNRAAQSIIDGLNKQKTSKIELIYAGDTLSSGSIYDLLQRIEGKKVCANIIAKNFATLEPGIAFRALREQGEKSCKSIEFILTGSFGNGQLHELSKKHGYLFYEFPEEVGGRFSALTAVGLLPMAVMDVDIRAFKSGALDCEHYLKKAPPVKNSAVRYAAIRFLLQKKGFLVENLACFEPHLERFSKWWLQLHGETEGKNDNAILPVITQFSEDLHAIGQYIQQGRRFIFETLLHMMERTGVLISTSGVEDGFSYLDGKYYDTLNETVFSAVARAHSEGGIPVIKLFASDLSEAAFGELMYWQMFSSYMSGALMGIEPFDQEGVENYKRIMRKELEQ